MTEISLFPTHASSTYSTTFVKIEPINDSGTWWEYDYSKKQLKVCAGNGNDIFNEDDNSGHKHFTISSLTSDAPGQLHSPLPDERLLSLKCGMVWEHGALPTGGVKERKQAYYQFKGKAGPSICIWWFLILPLIAFLPLICIPQKAVKNT